MLHIWHIVIYFKIIFLSRKYIQFLFLIHTMPKSDFPVNYTVCRNLVIHNKGIKSNIYSFCSYLKVTDVDIRIGCMFSKIPALGCHAKHHRFFIREAIKLRQSSANIVKWSKQGVWVEGWDVRTSLCDQFHVVI